MIPSTRKVPRVYHMFNIHKMGRAVMSLLWIYAEKQAKGQPVQKENSKVQNVICL